MIACAMTFVIISGDIDVSVGGAVAWASSLARRAGDQAALAPGAGAVLFVLGLGILIHALAGGIRVKWGIPAFVVTLAMMHAYKGLAKVITNAYPITPFPESFSLLGPGLRLQGDPGARGADADHRSRSSIS